MHTFSRAHARTITTGAMTLAMGSLAVALAASASAHVNVSSTDARQGGSGKVTVRVPNESETAGTIKVSVSMPKEPLLSSVRVKPHAGWTFTAPKVKLAAPVKQGDTTITEAVATITWTADKGVSIKAGSFDEFEFSAGKMPTDKTSVSFAAVQTYSDGKVVSWNEAKLAGAEEPKHPSPVLELMPAKGAEKAAAVVAPAAAKAGDDSLARGLAGGAGVLALGGLGLGLQRRRSSIK
jgi:periplasmic copper chaperone A